MSARGGGPSELSRALESVIHTTTRDDDAYWEALPALRVFPTSELFTRMASLAHDPDPRIQTLVPDVLRGVPALATRTIPLLRTMLNDGHPDVIAAIGYALRELDRDEALEQMLPYTAHEEVDVREAVVHALLANEDARAIAALIRLSSDDDASIRDWATFGLGSQIDVDTFEIREALAARLDDDDGDTSAEAVVGLAARSDDRALAWLKRVLRGEELWPHHVEAAFHLRAPELVPLLRAREKDARRLKGLHHSFDEAIAACTVDLP